ncbi:general stress protein CsbD [Bacteroidota bacterium]
MKVMVNEEGLNDLKTKLKNKFPLLTNKDLIVTNYNTRNMLTMAAYKLHKSKEEMSIIIEEL